MSTTTANLGLTLPTPNVDVGWGGTLNTDFTLIDNLFASDGSGTSVGMNIGTGKTLLIGGTLLLGTGDGTGTLAAPTIRGPAAVGSNVSGAALTFQASNGTGTGGSGGFIFRTAPASTSSSTANTFRNALSIARSSDTFLVDIGAGGTVSTNGTAAARLNGSSAGVGTDGGAALYIGNNSVSTAAFGNRSNIFGGSTAFNDDATLWGRDSLSFVVGSGALAASSEKMKLGSSGQLYFWDTTLSTPALNAGTAGQFLMSNGASAAPTWSDGGLQRATFKNFGSSGIEFKAFPSGLKSITVMVDSLDPTATGTDAIVQLGTGAAPTYVTTGYTGSGSAINSSSSGSVLNSDGFRLNLSGQPASGTIRLTNITGNTWVCDYTMAADSGTGGSFVGGGVLALSAVLTAVRIIPKGGSTPAFATTGGANVLYI
jgi:hypothetical protein